MIPKEILEKILRIDITTNRLVTDVFAGAYHSVFKGRGMEFDEVREYQPGDDIRSIDWNVTARTGAPHVKKYVEERELTVMILVDASASVHFASTNQMKNKLAAEIAAVLAFAAIRNNDKVGLLMFTDGPELFIPPKKGKTHVLRVVREILYFKPQAKATNLPLVLEHLTKVVRRRSTVFIISDFLDPNPGFLRKSMRVANQHHDLIAISLTDPREVDLPDCGLIELEDAESGAKMVVDTSHDVLRKVYHTKALDRIKERNRLFDIIGMDHIDISTDVPYTKALAGFFAQRRRRLSR
ncbi:MAG: DUF58 domain-containing protein [Candidatus Omnitrophica bacterium]|nr:DUF58 domain-containing protein [Candidatus Omnitrophota bacterium]MDE2008900.1 DUF58 domain-containing protein [Candidatus Omnitrophota bacterium]MDE2213537.1 DUF58 domain-containing protein [Candidatus Omnitrophota bacterium]MDE2230562.1 DUF58 domain-containing protein [Candidatus Omnitrophota bacterium]